MCSRHAALPCDAASIGQARGPGKGGYFAANAPSKRRFVSAITCGPNRLQALFCGSDCGTLPNLGGNCELEGSKMALSKEMRRMLNKWDSNNGWPKRLEWLELEGIRGWHGQRVDFLAPITAIVGENGSGKSTILQAAASAYRQPAGRKETYASDHFPDTPFERISGATIRASVREGDHSTTRPVTKRTNRWRGYNLRPERAVEFLDLSRIQPVNARAGYAKLLKSNVKEGSHQAFNESQLSRFSTVMGKSYEAAGISLTDADTKKTIPVLSLSGARYSGFHQGAGEIAAAELLAAEYPRYGLVLIDEIETSLHPRAQRRLMRDLATVARLKEIQIIVSTHSPFILNELPERARIYILNSTSGRRVVTGVSAEFAMTKMDEDTHPECDVYVEDERSSAFLNELLIALEPDISDRVTFIPFGAASVGNALGTMKSEDRFRNRSLVFLDGDQSEAAGCHLLPGEDAPERVVFERLADIGWGNVAERIGRAFADTLDALSQSMTLSDHHDWPREAANRLKLSSQHLWQAMCATYANVAKEDAEVIEAVQIVKDEVSKQA